MKQNPDSLLGGDTSRLLAELDQAIDHSNVMRDIARRREQLQQLERLTGPSPHTRALGKEIWLLEQQLRADRIEAKLAPPITVVPS